MIFGNDYFEGYTGFEAVPLAMADLHGTQKIMQDRAMQEMVLGIKGYVSNNLEAALVLDDCILHEREQNHKKIKDYLKGSPRTLLWLENYSTPDNISSAYGSMCYKILELSEAELKKTALVLIDVKEVSLAYANYDAAPDANWISPCDMLFEKLCELQADGYTTIFIYDASACRELFSFKGIQAMGTKLLDKGVKLICGGTSEMLNVMQRLKPTGTERSFA